MLKYDITKMPTFSVHMYNRNEGLFKEQVVGKGSKFKALCQYFEHVIICIHRMCQKCLMVFER
jgi:hypothetical protein